MVAKEAAGAPGEAHTTSLRECYEAVLEATDQLLIITDADGMVLDLNRAALEFAGVDRNEACGKLFSQLAPWNNSLEVQELLQNAITNTRTGAAFRKTFQIQKSPDTEAEVITVTANPVVNDLSRVTAIIIQGFKAQQSSAPLPAFASIEEQVQIALEIAGVGYWSWDVRRDKLTTHSFLHRLLGLPADSYFKNLQAGLELVVPEDRPILEQYLRKSIETKCSYSVDFRLQSLDGSVRWLNTKAGARCDASGKVIEICGVTSDITERKNAEAALARSERQYLDLVNSLDGIVWEANGESFQFLFVSRQAERILGYPSEDWKSDPEFWAKHLHPDDLSWCVEFCREATQTGRDHEFEYRMIAADGRVVWLHDVVSVHVEADGSKRLRGIMLDISARKVAEQALKDSEERFRLMFERSAAAMAITDVDGRVLDVNQAFCSFCAFSPEELKGSRLEDIAHREDRAELAGRFREFGEGHRTTIDLEARFIQKDQRVAWGRVTAALFSQAEPGYCIAVISDITAQKKAEAILRESEVRFRIVANDTPAYLWLTSGAEENSFINKPLARFLGTDLDHLGIGWVNYIHPDDALRAREVFTDCMTERCAYRDEFRLRRSDGEYRDVIDEGVPRFSPAGEFLGYAGSVIDVTERKRAEEQLRTAHDLLASELAERRRAEQEILALSERLISAQEEERSRIARELHDNLSQQIAALSISVSNLKRRIPGNLHESHEHAERLGSGLLRLAQSIRTISHELHPAILEHSGLSAALAQFCKEFTAISGVEVEFHATESFSDLAPEPALCIYRVTQEALQNVWKHAETKRANVFLTRTGSQACLIVSDRGRGFAPSRSRATGGLGLVSMKERVRLVHGSLDVNSGPNQGTAIVVRVPL